MDNTRNMPRAEWVGTLYKISTPVLRRLAEGRLKDEMPKVGSGSADQYLEAFGRTLCGLAPWLELEDIEDRNELLLQEQCRKWTFAALRNITDNDSPDYISFTQSHQSLVDAAYLSEGLLRMPKQWRNMDSLLRKRVIDAIKQTRCFKCPENNWLLFQSVREAFLMANDITPNEKMLERGVKMFSTIFYQGDGMYGDGRSFAMDYYNSYVIHPMLMDTLRVCKQKAHKLSRYYDKARQRCERYLEIQERSISPEGSFPLYGRTLICRLGAFHALAQGVYTEILPASVTPQQVRGAMDALLSRFLLASGNFDSNDFLTIGFNGRQRDFAETYVSAGSPYHICTFFLPLGLSAKHPFWSTPSEEWTSRKAYTGEKIPYDHALNDMTLRESFIIEIKRLMYLLKLRFCK